MSIARLRGCVAYRVTPTEDGPADGQTPDLTEARWRPAFRRAIARLGTHAPVIEAVQRDADGGVAGIWLSVPSASGEGGYRLWYAPAGPWVVCDCDAGAAGHPCWHAAVAYLWLRRDSRLADPVRVRVALGQYADPAAVERERARLAAALAGVLV